MDGQARKHVGQRIDGQLHKIEAAIALRYPNRIDNADDIDEVLKEAKDLKYCAVYPNKGRFPTTGWLTGSVSNLADLIYLDPPWNSNADYNILWDKGANADEGFTAQETAFTDMW